MGVLAGRYHLSMPIIGRRSPPRALIMGFDSETADRLGSLFETALQVSGYQRVRLDEWDLLITNETWASPDGPLYVIGFGSTHYGPVKTDTDATLYWKVSYESQSVATEYDVPDELSPGVRYLVERQLLPLAQTKAANPVLRVSTRYTNWGRSTDAPIIPFLRTTEPNVLAGWFHRREATEEKPAIAWCLPPGLPDPVPWVKAALAEWHAHDSITFPEDPSWKSHRDWRTPEERALVEELDILRTERERFLTKSTEQEERLVEELNGATQRGDAQSRALLTERAERLVSVVKSALEDMKFHVEEMDAPERQGDLLEDLQVTSPDDPEWIALVEVRSYKGGASVGDLARLERFTTRFLQAEGKLPSRKWYIANQQAGLDPATRQPILQSNPVELREFGAGNGLAIDTSELFKLWMAVRDGTVIAEEARRQLMTGTGRFVAS